jgi:hypothetical protein
MDPLVALETVAGFLLVFFVPGYAVTKALFPEWRIRGPEAYLRLLEIFSLGFVLSIVLTVLVGYVLLVGSPSGFQAYWSTPALEAALLAIAVVAITVASVRGAFARVPPPTRGPPAVDADEEDVWRVTRELDRLAREERALLRSLKRAPPTNAAEETRLRARLEAVRARSEELGRRREADIAD